MVAVGMGVSVGRGVPVGCNCATAVPKAWVSAMFRSGVGEDVAEGVHAVRSTASRMRLEKKRVNFCMGLILSEKCRGRSQTCPYGVIRCCRL